MTLEDIGHLSLEVHSKKTEEWRDKCRIAEDFLYTVGSGEWEKVHDLEWPTWSEGVQGPQLTEWRQGYAEWSVSQ